MIVTIDTDKKEIVIEKATVQELYEYIGIFGLLDYSIVTKKTTKISGDDFDIDKCFKFYYNIM